MSTTWIVVAAKEKARIFAFDKAARGLTLEREIVGNPRGDRAGAPEGFLSDIATYLDTHAVLDCYDGLVLVCEPALTPKFAYALKRKTCERVLGTIMRSGADDSAGLIDEIERRFGPQL